MDNTAAGRINLTQLCRVCLMEFKEMYSLFSFIQFDDNLKKPVYLYEMLMSVSSMKISSEDHLPTKVCTNCKQLAHTSYKFQQQCNRSQEILDSYLPNKQFIEEKPLNLDNDENMQCSRSQETLDSYLSDKHLMVEQKPLNLDIEENTQSNQNEEIKEDSRFVDNAFVKIEVDESTAEFVALENDVPSQQDLPIHQLEERHFDNSSDICCEEIPSDIEEDAASPISLLLPEKSKHIYEIAFTHFDQWCSENKVGNISEKVLLAYFKEKSATLKPSSLWAKYSMLRSMISIRKNINISTYKTLMAFLKGKAEKYKPMESRIFRTEDFVRFLKEANDYSFLMMKVAFIIGVAGACRREELTFLLRENVKDGGNFIQVQIPDSRTKLLREFVVMDGNIENTSLTEIVRKYINLRPAGTDHQRFFVSYRNGKCTKQPVGINTIGSVPKNIALFLQLDHPEQFTGRSFRRSSATLLADAGADILTLKRHGGWSSNAVANSCINNFGNVKSEYCYQSFL